MARPRSDDGGVWHLTWQRTTDGRFRAWVVGNPDVNATASRWKDVERALYERIRDELQGGEWTPEWSPSPPFEEDQRCWVDPRYVVLWGSGRHFGANRPDTLYEGGLCEGCGQPRGPRNGTTLVTGIDAPGGIAKSAHGCPHIMREETAALLGPEGLGGAALREVHRVTRGTARYVEPVPARAIACVAITAPAMCWGWHCPRCGYRSPTHRYTTEEFQAFSFFSASAIPSDATSFWVDRAGHRLCVRADWWHAHRRKPELKGVTAGPLLVAPDDAVDPSPSLPACPPHPPDAHRDQIAAFLRSAKVKLPPGVGDWLGPPFDAASPRV